jgi:hypothetical protein
MAAPVDQGRHEAQCTVRKDPRHEETLRNDQILCGNVAFTQYTVTPMKDAVTPLGIGKHYLICSASTPANSQCSNQAMGYFDLATAQPMDQPVAPGHVQLFGNPTKDQIWNQPSGTKAIFIGTFDLTLANLIGNFPGGGGDGGGGISSVTGAAPISLSAGSAPVVSIAKADSTHDGYLGSSDWNTFNSKVYRAGTLCNQRRTLNSPLPGTPPT